MSGLSPRLPLEIDSTDGYRLLKDYISMVKQNMRMLVLTIPGERMMDPDFGVGLRQYLFELDSVFPYGEIDAAIRKQVRRYLPYIEIRNIGFTSFDQDAAIVNNSIRLRIEYRIIPLEAFDAVEISESAS